MRKFLIAVIVLVLVALGIFLCLPTIVDRRMNVVELAPPYNASERARPSSTVHARFPRGFPIKSTTYGWF
jgi:hypothetical protein